MGYPSRVDPQKIGSSHKLTHFCFGLKNSGLGQVFSSRAGLGQQIFTLFAMSSLEAHEIERPSMLVPMGYNYTRDLVL